MFLLSTSALNYLLIRLFQLEVRRWRDLLLIGKICSKKRQTTNNLCRFAFIYFLIIYCAFKLLAVADNQSDSRGFELDKGDPLFD